LKILIMAGGSGERFWPLSTKENPKQLLSLVSNKSMIRETVDRILKLVQIEDVYIATNLIQVPGVRRELPDIIEENIIIEPAFKDTAAAIAYGSTIIARTEVNPTIVVLASDHLIQDNDNFIKILKKAEKEANNGFIVTLGIKPSRPETGYGYINIDNLEIGKIVKANKFMEKPNYDIALEYIESGNYVWNSGMFVFEYDTIMNELGKYKPNHVNIINNIKAVIGDLKGIELSEKVKFIFDDFERVSIDFAVMEHSKIVKCIPVDFGWNDVGGYNSLDEIFPKDESGNIIKDCNYIYVDSNNNIVISDNHNKLITSIGVSNMIIVDSKDGLLICNRSQSQRIKEIIKKI